MRRPVRRPSRPNIRAELATTDVPTWRAPRFNHAQDLTLYQAPGRLPRGRRVYAVGDIHGCLSQLTAVHRTIAEDMTRRAIASATLVHLGDYIDHGPDSAAVIELLAAGDPIPGLRTINLRGDHEAFATLALQGDRAAATDWLHGGGEAALASWGIAQDTPRERWASLIPATHIAFLQSRDLEYREGDYLFVHAGIRPGVRLAEQNEDDLLGIRQTFLASEADFGVIVVHGHSAGPAPVVKPNRVGLDTGAGFGGALTCAVLESDSIGFLSAGPTTG